MIAVAGVVVAGFIFDAGDVAGSIVAGLTIALVIAIAGFLARIVRKLGKLLETTEDTRKQVEPRPWDPSGVTMREQTEQTRLALQDIADQLADNRDLLEREIKANRNALDERYERLTKRLEELDLSGSQAAQRLAVDFENRRTLVEQVAADFLRRIEALERADAVFAQQVEALIAARLVERVEALEARQ